MVFSSSIFLLFFLPIVLFIYFISEKRYKNYILLLASIVFYSWGAPKFIFVIIATTFLDFILVSRLYKSTNKRARKVLLILSVSVNLGLLFYFKYCNFFIENTNALLGCFNTGPVKMLDVILPIGISFYTFETITYVVDVYRGVHKPLEKFLDYLLYILFFPKLIAGPIARYHEISDQLTNRNENIDTKINGLFRFIIGLSKKVLIANVLAEQADYIFGLPLEDITTNHAWSGALLYTFQIYFDFSGYSDMAIGLALLFGFKLPENFNNPYISQSITEFWRRWHMTLGNWMKNYLYIPLGGNKVNSKLRLYFNLSLVFIISGFWHGAAWTFIIWGAYHGLFLIMERLFLLNVYKKIGKLFSTALTFLFVLIGWVFFRADSFSQAILFIKKMFRFHFTGQLVFLFEEKLIWILGLAFISCFIWANTAAEKFQQKLLFNSPGLLSTFFKSTLGIVLFIICLGSIIGSNFNPFIYFRF